MTNIAPSPSPNPNQAPADASHIPWGEQKTYAPDAKGDIYATYTLSEPGTDLNWRDHHPTNALNRQIMLTTETGKQLYVYGDRIFDVEASKDQGKPVTIELPVDGELPNATIGESWTTPLGTTEPIAKVEILGGKLNAMEAHEVQEDFPITADRNEIAEIAAIFAPHQSNGYKILRRDLLKQGAIQKAQATKEQARRVGRKAKAAAAAGKHITKNAVLFTADVSKEVVLIGSELTKFAMIRSGAAAAAFAKSAKNEYYDAETDFALKLAEKYLRLGAFATALRTEMPEIAKYLDDTKQLDKIARKLPSYDKDNVRVITNQKIKRAKVHAEAAREAKKVAKKAWKNRKA